MAQTNNEAQMATATETVQMISVKALRPHPKNPRLSLRQDVIEAIAAGIEELKAIEPRHAITVRPAGEQYEIISGHHRHAAAVKCGLDSVPCWVVDMNDDEAYMALATSNNQGELASLEIGLHALDAVPLEKGVKGGGLAAYAKKIGKQKQNVSTYRKGADVYRHVSKACNNDITGCRDKAHHLGCIADDGRRELWPAIVSALLSGGWSVADTDHWVGKVKEFQEPEGCSLWLPLAGIVERFLDTKEFSAQTVRKLAEERNAIMDLIHEHREEIERSGQLAEGWMDEVERWLIDNQGGKSWDVRQIIGYRLEIEERIRKSGPNQWLHGNWRDYVDSVIDGSVSVLLTDPPYGMGYQSDHRVDRRKERRHDKIENDGAGEGPSEVAEFVTAFMPKLTADAHVFVFTNWRNEEAMRAALVGAGLAIRGSLVWVKNAAGMGDPNTTFAPKHERIIHAVKGSPILFTREADVMEFDRVNADRHPTEKPVDLLCHILKAVSVEGQRVADPFGGVASTCEAARSIGRHYWACEINEDYWKAGCSRLSQDDAGA
jgi:ParB/RepB/Spo0J family partition protein